MDAHVISWSVSGVIGIAVFLFVRLCPKQKLMDMTGPWFRNLGRTVSAFGNSKIGKVLWQKCEEGFVFTLLAVLMNADVEFGKGLAEDNEVKK